MSESTAEQDWLPAELPGAASILTQMLKDDSLIERERRSIVYAIKVINAVHSLKTNVAGPELPAVTSARPLSGQAAHVSGSLAGRPAGGTAGEPVSKSGDSAKYPAPAAPESSTGPDAATPRAWRIKAMDGDDLIDVWKRRPKSSDEYSAAHFIEQLERELAEAQQAFAELMASDNRLQRGRSSIAPIPEGCTPADAMVLREGNAILAEENHALRRCLRFYANGKHFSGLLHFEGPIGDDNWLCAPIDDDERAEFVAKIDEVLVEDGSVARVTLVSGKFEVESPEDEPNVVRGEPEWLIEQQAASAGDSHS